MSRWVGRTVSKVQIQKLLSRGGMAEVYLGRHTTLDRPVAVKVLFSHLNENPELLERFRREARAVAALRHPNIVQVYDFDVDEEDGLPYIVMELLQGIPLSEYLARLRNEGREGSLRDSGQVPLDTVARLATDVASALDYAHARGIVHRDIKPSNVFLRRESGPITLGEPLPADVEPVLLDFGVMRVAEGEAAKTVTGTIIGTPAYMSPEQAAGEPVDARSDVYSFGVMLYEMISGQPPFDPATLTPTALLIKHISAPLPPLPNASSELQAVLARALAKNREERYQHAGELAEGLRQAIAQTEGKASDLASMPTRVSRPIESHTAAWPGAPSEPQQQTHVISAPETIPHADRPGIAGESKATRTGPAEGGDQHAQTNAVVASGPPVEANHKRSSLPLYLGTGLAVVLVMGAIFLFSRNLFASGGTSPTNATPTAAVGSQVGSATPSVSGTIVGGAGSDGTQAPGNLRFFDQSRRLDQVTLSVHGLAQPPDGTRYEAWLLGEEGETRQSMGVLNVKPDGTGELTYNDPGGNNLLAQFDSFQITAEPKGDTNPLPNGPVVYADALPQKALVHLKHLLVAFPSTVGQTSLCVGLLEQTTKLNEIAQTLLEAQQGGDVGRMKRDAEEIINLIEGENGEHFGDRDGDGFTDNPGDGYGLLLNGKNLGYIQGTFDHARLAAEAPDATDNIKLHASHVMTAAQNLSDWAVQARDLSLRIVAADSTATGSKDVRDLASLTDRMLNGKDLNGNEKIDPVPGEAGAKLAYEHAHYMDDMFAYPKSGEALPPTAAETPVP